MNRMIKNIIALIVYTLIENIDDSSDSNEGELDIEILKEKRTRVPRIRPKNYVENIANKAGVKTKRFVFLLKTVSQF
ncbi:hypothetical protein ACFW04_014571 [Cataglyphis niger]